MTITIEHTDDVAFAQACIHGDPDAQRRFIVRFGAAIDEALRRHHVAPCDRADLRQALLERVLLDAPDRPAKLRGYRGTAPLASWLRVCVLREVLTLARRRRPTFELAHQPELAVRETPELRVLSTERRERFELAFGEALRELEPRERNLLRHRVLHGLDQDSIASMYGVHRVTVARWFMRMRGKLRDEVHRRIERGEPMLGGSGIDLHLSRLLGRQSELERAG